MKIFLATAATTKPEHSIHDAIFWLLTTLAVLIAVITFKILFETTAKEMMAWRRKRITKYMKGKKP